MRRRRAPLVLVTVAVVLAAVPVGSVSAAFPGDDGLIAFKRIGADGVSIVATTNDESTVTNLTKSDQSPFGDFDPAWSPGGTMIAFTRRTASGKGEIWRMSADGSHQVRLTTNAADDREPMWSPDGARIGFASDRAGTFDIWTMDLAGGSLRRLTTSVGSDRSPVWSPVGDRIMFTSDRAGKRRAYLMDADGTHETVTPALVGSGSEVTSADWRPDGATALLSVRGFGAPARVYEYDTTSWAEESGGVIKSWDVRNAAYAPSLVGVPVAHMVLESDQLLVRRDFSP